MSRYRGERVTASLPLGVGRSSSHRSNLIPPEKAATAKREPKRRTELKAGAAQGVFYRAASGFTCRFGAFFGDRLIDTTHYGGTTA
jgi:hypothetical protein